MIIRYIIYNKISGQVARHGKAVQEVVPLYAEGDFGVVTENLPDNPNDYRFDGETFIPLPPRVEGKPKYDHTTDSWVDYRDAATALSEVRHERNQRLRACDWTQIPDSALVAQTKQQWVTYRQALRDITNQTDPFNIVWPTKPEG